MEGFLVKYLWAARHLFELCLISFHFQGPCYFQGKLIENISQCSKCWTPWSVAVLGSARHSIHNWSLRIMLSLPYNSCSFWWSSLDTGISIAIECTITNSLPWGLSHDNELNKMCQPSTFLCDPLFVGFSLHLQLHLHLWPLLANLLEVFSQLSFPFTK